MEKLNLSPWGPSGSPSDPFYLARMKAETVNATPGGLTLYDCPKCLNRGWSAFVEEDGRLVFRDCECMTPRRCIAEMERSGLRNVIREKTFERYQAEEPWQKTVLQGAEDYARSLDGWLLLCGQSGSGKTHLCTAVCRQRLLLGEEVRYMAWRDSVAELKSLALDSDRRTQLLDGFKNAKLLYIDDLFKTGKNGDLPTPPTVADINLAFELINHRYITRLPTLISSERTPMELLEIDEATGSRIIEMAGQRVFCIEKNRSRNYRLRNQITV